MQARWWVPALAGTLVFFGLGLGASAAQAQRWGSGGPVVTPGATYYPGWGGYSRPWVARGYSYRTPSQGYGYYVPMRPPWNVGYGRHYGYFPARRGLKLYKPWLRRD
jgi:hypothetical protein